MRFLIDTHAFLWSFREPERLSRPVARLLTSSDSEVFLSVVSLWEIALKVRSGKIDLPEDGQFFAERMEAIGLRSLEVQFAHVERVFQLPDHHRDPFDRLLIAQAQVEGLSIITSDAAFSQYDVKVIW
jgi:PIN domain nuclease of toxin-antitoxin system